MAFPFCPITDEMLRKLSRVIQDSNQTINSHDLPAVFATQDFKSASEIKPQRSETNKSDISTDNLL